MSFWNTLRMKLKMVVEASCRLMRKIKRIINGALQASNMDFSMYLVESLDTY